MTMQKYVQRGGYLTDGTPFVPEVADTLPLCKDLREVPVNEFIGAVNVRTYNGYLGECDGEGVLDYLEKMLLLQYGIDLSGQIKLDLTKMRGNENVTVLFTQRLSPDIEYSVDDYVREIFFIRMCMINLLSDLKQNLQRKADD